MIIEQSIPIVILIEIMAVFLVIFSLRHLSIARRFESDVDKGIVTWFMAGLILLGMGSMANMVGLFGLHSYLVQGIPFQAFWVLASVAFLVGVVKLRKS
ncbi:MAG: hypothetical protein PHO02_06725 [Candidatus Nanoarchaeia archaeon]|nr:hypothetical protein [Candidatus Nanoarchaeia archaeon]